MYLYTLLRRRRSAYMHLSGAGEAGEAEEVFVYTALYELRFSEDSSSMSNLIV